MITTDSVNALKAALFDALNEAVPIEPASEVMMTIHDGVPLVGVAYPHLRLGPFTPRPDLLGQRISGQIDLFSIETTSEQVEALRTPVLEIVNTLEGAALVTGAYISLISQLPSPTLGEQREFGEATFHVAFRFDFTIQSVFAD